MRAECLPVPLTHLPPEFDMEPALSIRSVSKRYTGHLAVDDISLSVPAGTIYGILGPNGAGKSTLIRMVMDIIARDSGEIELLGTDPSEDKTVLRRVGYLPEERGLYRKMKVIDVIIFFGQLKGLNRNEARAGGEEWLERMGLGEWGKAKVETLSKGMQQKVQFITTVLHDPDLLILDEPTSGLDPVNQEVLRDTILSARERGKSVIFCTHNMGQAEQLCDHVCIISGGSKVLDGELREIRKRHRGTHHQLEFDERTARVEEFMQNNRLFSEVRPTKEGWEVELAPGVDTGELLSAVSSLDSELARFGRVDPSLHDIFVNLVGKTAATPRHREVANV